jgi:hypothetical protein
LTSGDLALIRDVAGAIQRRLDSATEVFLDELPAARP